MMDIKEVLLRWFMRFLIKRTSGGTIKRAIKSTKELAEKLHKPITKKFKKRKVIHNIWTILIDNIRGADLSIMQSKNKFDKGISF